LVFGQLPTPWVGTMWVMVRPCHSSLRMLMKSHLHSITTEPSSLLMQQQENAYKKQKCSS